MSRRFTPDWRKAPPAHNSWRSIFKWGDPLAYKHPNRRLFATLKDIFDLTDLDFSSRRFEGDDEVRLHARPCRLPMEHLERLRRLCGPENVQTDDYARVRHSVGKTIEEAMELRHGLVEHVCDVVVHPRCKEEVAEIVRFADDEGIAVTVYGGGSSVNFGFRPEKGGIVLALGTHMNRVLAIDELDQTCTVQPGILGPAYEDILNRAPELFGTRHAYTCGHFPQSFEYSSVGGWVVTLGSGQNSTYYGDAAHIVFSQEYVTPAGILRTEQFSACANGPRFHDIMKGSEGVFGILVEVKMRIFRHMPENRLRFGFMFRSFADAVDFGREVSQGEFGMPSVFRISDEEETDIGLKLYGIEGTPVDLALRVKGFSPGKRALVLGHTEGEKHFSKNVHRRISELARDKGGMTITGYGTKMWEHGRYRDPYLREALGDYGILIDTLETSVRWSSLHEVHRRVRAFVKSRPRTVCMAHASHFYPQGTNLYFIFIMRTDSVDEYREFQTGVIDAIAGSGGSLSHHHGVGRMIAPWMESFHGPLRMAIYRAIKSVLDPRGILNPGMQMGLSVPENLKRDARRDS